MSLSQLFKFGVEWLLADPTHVIAAAGLIAAVVPTPEPTSRAGKLFKVVDVLALNILHAKETGLALPTSVTTAATLAEDIKAAKVKYILPLLSMLALSACANPYAVPETQITTCDAVNGALQSVNQMDDRGVLSEPQKAIVRDVVKQTRPICGAGSILASDAGAQAQVLTGALTALQGILTTSGAQ